jgi:hypothetical protein
VSEQPRLSNESHALLAIQIECGQWEFMRHAQNKKAAPTKAGIEMLKDGMLSLGKRA